MSLKVRKNNGAQSYSPQNNWKSSSRRIGPTSVSWLRPSKGGHPKIWDINRPSLGTSMVFATERLWMLGLPKWRITYMPPRLDDIRPWSLPNPN